MIGRGRSSVVYRGYRIPVSEVYDTYQSPIALKVLQENHRGTVRAKSRAQREARALTTCVHHRVVRLLDYVARDDLSYISMEVAELGDLGQIFKESKKRLGVKAVVKLMKSILEGVEAIHKSGIIHRDLKLENIFLTADFQVKIGDFGVCLFEDDIEKLSDTKEVVGTIEYQAPEVLKGGNFTTQSDLYSVGIICYRIITGNFPFGGRSIRDALFQKIRGEYVDLPVSLVNKYPLFEDFFRKALNPRPELRFRDSKEMIANLEYCVERTESRIRLSKTNNKESTKEVNSKEINRKSLSLNLKKYFNQCGKKFLGSIYNSANQILEYQLIKRTIIISFILGTLVGFISPLFSSVDSYTNVSADTHLTAVSNNISTIAYDELVKNTAFGVIKGLYTPGRDYKFSLTPLSNNSVLFSLAVSGWESVPVDLSDLKEGKPLKIEGRGVSLLLNIDSIEEETLIGRYENLILGSRGSFSMKLIADK